jgi:phage-related protein
LGRCHALDLIANDYLPVAREYGTFTIMAEDDAQTPKPVHWLGSSQDSLRKFPKEVAREIGYALWFAQVGEKHPSAKPLRGFKGASVLEVVQDHAGDTYRAVYTVRFARAVYVLHVFQKKSKSGVKTPRHEVELIEARLKWAKLDYEQWLKEIDNHENRSD